MKSKHQELVELWTKSREESLALAEKWMTRRAKREAVGNLYAVAAGKALLTALVEWRLGSGDPSEYLRLAVQDALKAVDFYDPTEDIALRSSGMIAFYNAAYAQILLDQPIAEYLRKAAFISSEERCLPREYSPSFRFPWDSLVLELVVTGSVPREWDAFFAFLSGRNGTKNYTQTMAAYRKIIGSAHAGDKSGAEKAIRDAEKQFYQRCENDVTWGGGKLSDQMVDLRLACAVKKAETIYAAIASIKSVHRWRW